MLATKLDTTCLIINTVAFTSCGRQKCFVNVGDDGVVRVYSSVSGHFTRCHSITANVQGRIRARFARELAEEWKRSSVISPDGEGRVVGVDVDGVTIAWDGEVKTVVGFETADEWVRAFDARQNEA